MGRKVHYHDLQGGAEMLFCGPLGGSHAEAGVFGSVGEGLEAVFVCSAMEEEGSCPSLGDSVPVWDPDDFSEFSWGIFSTSGPSSPCWPGPSFFRILHGGLLGWLSGGLSGLWRADTLFLFLPLDDPEAIFI